MSFEASVHADLGALVDGQAWPDVVPDEAIYPLFVYQQIGGRSRRYIDNTRSSTRNARLQVRVWAETREQASALAHQAEDALVASAAYAAVEPVGAFVSDYDDIVKKYGARQDFSIWYAD
ncbi:MAG: DUF3168 domain-containing protein [Rhodocyclaceae bacterium]